MCKRVAQELKVFERILTDLQGLRRPSDRCGSSEASEDSEADTGEDTYVAEFDNDDDDSDSEGDVEKRETTLFQLLSCSR